MQRRPTTKAQNSIAFLSHLSNQKLPTLNIHDRMGIIIRSREFIEKHKLMENVQINGKCECRSDSWSGGDLHGAREESRIIYHLAKENRLASPPVIRS